MRLGLHSPLQIVVVAIKGKYQDKSITSCWWFTKCDQHIVALGGHNNHREYEQIVKYFKVNHCVMVLFKNIAPTSFRDCFLKCDYYTISSIMIDEDTRHHLQSIHLEINCSTPPTQKVWRSSK